MSKYVCVVCLEKSTDYDAVSKKPWKREHQLACCDVPEEKREEIEKRASEHYDSGTTNILVICKRHIQHRRFKPFPVFLFPLVTMRKCE